MSFACYNSYLEIDLGIIRENYFSTNVMYEKALAVNREDK